MFSCIFVVRIQQKVSLGGGQIFIFHFSLSREKAIEYMVNYTSFSRPALSIEIDRYITWPGQACAYKIGELKIWELRHLAESLLGEKQTAQTIKV